VLSAELAMLAEKGFDMNLLAMDDELLNSLLPVPEKHFTGDPDDAPSLDVHSVSQPGDIWQLGDHRVMCGSATVQTDMNALVSGEKVNMWLTDPPYNVAYEGKTKDALTIKNDSMGDTDFLQFLKDAYAVADSVMHAGAAFYIWHADLEGYNFRGAAQAAGWKVRQCLIWVKSQIVMGRQDYHWKHEPCLYGWKDGAAHNWASDRKQSTVLEFDKPSRNGEHPTMKPVALIEYQLKNNTNAGDIVLDSFLGSGTTLMAAEKSGRRCYGLELDPKYVDVIIKRWQHFTGRKATLEDGRTFAEVSNGR
jgi:site-specific DNA-methyltransferase (adenine-specific)